MGALLSAGMLCGCGGAAVVGNNSGGTGGGGGSAAIVVPSVLAHNVDSILYSARNQTINVTMTGVDSTPAAASFVRNAALDVPGYEAFTVQEDALDRFFIALAAESADGSVQAGVAGDGGQFTRFYAGTHYSRTGGFDAPPVTGTGPGTGQVSYAGTYAGVTNLGLMRDPDTGAHTIGSDQTLDVPAGTDESLFPHQAARVSGDIFLNANFADNLVNGAVYNREIVDTNMALATIYLVDGAIDANGTFTGAINLEDHTVVGDFAGVFGGTDAASVAGTTHLSGFEDAFDNEEEYGVFVLGQCGNSGASSICDDVAPTLTP